MKKHKFTEDQINEARAFYAKAPQFSADNTHEAMLVVTTPMGRKNPEKRIGMNYWTVGTQVGQCRIHRDGSRSTVVAPLYI